VTVTFVPAGRVAAQDEMSVELVRKVVVVDIVGVVKLGLNDTGDVMACAKDVGDCDENIAGSIWLFCKLCTSAARRNSAWLLFGSMSLSSGMLSWVFKADLFWMTSRIF